MTGIALLQALVNNWFIRNLCALSGRVALALPVLGRGKAYWQSPPMRWQSQWHATVTSQDGHELTEEPFGASKAAIYWRSQIKPKMEELFDVYST